MHFCNFCGKGPFSDSSKLKKHIRNSIKCNEAQRKEWDVYATKIWNNTPAGPSKQQPPSPPVPEDDEVEDNTLEDDILVHDNDIISSRGDEPENPPNLAIRPETRATVGDANEGDNHSEPNFFIEEFPQHLGAGAVWGEDVPFFEELRREQEENGSSRWGPFEDQDEWELAMWLIRNVGHKQINAFSNLNIVSSRHFLRLDSDINRK